MLRVALWFVIAGSSGAQQTEYTAELLSNPPRHFETLALGHSAPGPWRTQADVSVIYFKFTPTLEHTMAYDISMFRFQMIGDGATYCMMVSIHELPMTPRPGASMCHEPVLQVDISNSNPEFCAPSPDPQNCNYYIGVRSDGVISTVPKIGVHIEFTEPMFRHLFLSRHLEDHLHPSQKFRYTAPSSALTNQVIFAVFMSNWAMAQQPKTELLISLDGFPEGPFSQMGVHRAAAPAMEITFNKQMLTAAEKIYKNLTFYINIYAPSVPVMPDGNYSNSSIFTVQTRVLDSSGFPVPQPTAPPTYRPRENTQSTSPYPPLLIGNPWIYVARLFAAACALCVLCFLRSAISYWCKRPETRRLQELGDLIEQSKRNIEYELEAREAARTNEGAVELHEVRHATGA